MSMEHPAPSDTFEIRFDEFVAKFDEAARYGNGRAMQDLRVAMSRLAEKAGGKNFLLSYRGFQREVDHACGLTKELGRSKRLREKASYYTYRLHEGHLQDTPA